MHLTPPTRGPFSGPFNTNVEKVPSLFIPDENMKCHFSPPDSIQSHGDVDNKDSNGDNDDFQVTRSQEVMEGGEKKESQKPRCHSQQGIHRWNLCTFGGGIWVRSRQYLLVWSQTSLENT